MMLTYFALHLQWQKIVLKAAVQTFFASHFRCRMSKMERPAV
jgi:hypothetical protein